MKIHTRRAINLELLKADQGDVPGWVLITLMTAGLVVVIWAFAAPALQGVFDEAMDRVVKF
jgi:F0F1-type ATP synthase membrane subunit b/b'